MRRLVLAAALAGAFSSAAWGQAPPPGTYIFISGPGVGQPAFTVSGFSTSLGGSIGGIHIPNCAGIHVHGVFNGFPDPNAGGCGHGIIQLVAPPPGVSGGSLPGGMPGNVAGQLALTTGRGSPLDPAAAGDAFLLALAGFAAESNALARDAAGKSTYVSVHAPTILGLMVAVDSSAQGLSKTITTYGEALQKFAQTDRDAAQQSGSLMRTTFAEPAQKVLSSAAATSWLEDLAAFNVIAADGNRREADRTREQSDEWRKLADDARAQAERNRQRADEARKDGREADAKDWEREAQRDEERAAERDKEANRVRAWSDEQRRREAEQRELARERRAAAEAERERARQAERDRAERARRAAEEKARAAQEERDARRAKEQAEREARRQAQEDKARAREREIARQRAAREREHRAQLDAEQRARDQRARGSSSDADLAAAAARRKKEKEEQEETTWADLVIALLEGRSETPEEKLLQEAKEKLQEKLEEKIKEAALKRTGMDEVKEQLEEQLASKLDDLGLESAAGKLGEGVETLKKIKEIGDWMNAELDKNAGRQRRQMSKVDMLSDPNSRVERLRGASSGTIAGQDVLDVYKGAVEILK